jgi:hypothetical protein
MPVDTVTLHALREEVIVRPRVRDRHGNAIEEQILAWSSADPAIVAVDSGGRLIARAEGATMITASLGELADTLHVVVAPRGAITITFDDGWLTTYTNAFPILREHGLPANVGIYTDAVGWPAYMNESQLRELHDAGWSMVSHTVSHPNLTEVSDAQLLKEIRDSKAWLEERGFRGSNVFIVPFHEWGERERTLIEEHYDAARGVSYNQFSSDTLVEWMPTDPYALTAIEPEFLPYTTAEGRQILRRYLDRVARSGEYLDVFFHRIPDEDLDAFRKLVEIMAEHRDLIRPFHELFGPPRVLE